MSNEVSLLGSLLYKCLVFPESFPTDLFRPFFITFWWWFTSSRKVRYSSYRRPAHFWKFRPLHVFLSSSCYGLRAFLGYAYLKLKFMAWRLKGSLFHAKHLPILSTEFPLGPLFGGNFDPSLRVLVGLCYTHLPFQKHLSEPFWLKMFSIGISCWDFGST